MDEKKINELTEAYDDELAVLDEIRAENAARYEGLTEEEYVNQLAEDYEAIYAHAIENGMDIEVIPNTEDEE